MDLGQARSIIIAALARARRAGIQDDAALADMIARDLLAAAKRTDEWLASLRGPGLRMAARKGIEPVRGGTGLAPIVLGVPHCLKCNRAVDSYEIEMPFTESQPSGAPHAIPARTGEIILTVSCHGEEWRVSTWHGRL
jgi:hypothetical protein